MIFPTTMSASTLNIVPEQLLQVAVAAIMDDAGRVLISLRPEHAHQGGLWEFPGGKLEAGEDFQQALRREIQEELGVSISACQPLIRIPYRYPDRSVVLDVWKVTGYDGAPVGREGQDVCWRAPNDLIDCEFPAANRAIIRALQLPERYLVTPDPADNGASFLERLEASLGAGIRLVQLRARNLLQAGYVELAHQVVSLCHRYGARVLLNADPALVEQTGADGVHLNGRRLRALQNRPLGDSLWVAASCHSQQDLVHATAIGADFAVLSPVCATASHPGATPLGWPTFSEWVCDCTLPVYALGGMAQSDRAQAVAAGGQGIAAIRSLWERA